MTKEEKRAIKERIKEMKSFHEDCVACDEHYIPGSEPAPAAFVEGRIDALKWVLRLG